DVVASAAGSSDHGESSEIRTASGPTTETPTNSGAAPLRYAWYPETSDNKSAPGVPEAPTTPRAARSNENFTSAAVTGRPDENATPRRRTKSHTFWSGDAVVDADNCGSVENSCCAISCWSAVFATDGSNDAGRVTPMRRTIG